MVLIILTILTYGLSPRQVSHKIGNSFNYYKKKIKNKK